jgi:hypothetical protein
LQTAGNLQALQNAANQNALYRARVASGQDYQGAIGPNGQIDQNAFMRALSQDPQAAAMAQEAGGNALTQQNTQLANTTSQLGITGTATSNIRQDLASVAPDMAISDPKARAADQKARAAALIMHGASVGRYGPDSMGFAANFLGGNTPGGTNWQDDINSAANVEGPGAIALQAGNPSLVNTGSVAKTIRTFPQGGVTSDTGDAAAVPLTLSPSEKVSRTTYTDASGVTHTIPIGALASESGEPKAIPGVTGPDGSLTTALPPGAAEARATVGQASGAQYASELSASGQNQTMGAQLKTIDSLLNTPEGKTGPGTQVVNGWRNFAMANLPILTKVFPGTTEAQVQSATQDELKKYMTQIALQQSGSFGPSTNEKLAAAAAGNANPDMSNLGNQAVTRMNLALTRAQQARLAAFQQSGLAPEQYSTWASNWNRQVDPRAFMLDTLKPAERQSLLSTMTTPAARAALLRGKAAAEQAGLFQESDIPR